jgi:hypothetical protein
LNNCRLLCGVLCGIKRTIDEPGTLNSDLGAGEVQCAIHQWLPQTVRPHLRVLGHASAISRCAYGFCERPVFYIQRSWQCSTITKTALQLIDHQ